MCWTRHLPFVSVCPRSCRLPSTFRALLGSPCFCHCSCEWTANTLMHNHDWIKDYNTSCNGNLFCSFSLPSALLSLSPQFSVARFSCTSPPRTTLNLWLFLCFDVSGFFYFFFRAGFWSVAWLLKRGPILHSDKHPFTRGTLIHPYQELLQWSWTHASLNYPHLTSRLRSLELIQTLVVIFGYKDK